MWYVFNFGESSAVGMMSCERCGEQCEKTGARQKYCSACSAIRRAETNSQHEERRKSRRRKLGLFTCEMCLERHQQRGPVQRWCDNCREEGKADAARERSDAKRRLAGAKVIGEIFQCSECGDDVARRAAAHIRCDSCAEARKPSDAIICVDCGSTVKKTGTNQIRCGECRSLAEKARHKSKNKPLVIKCAECGEDTHRRHSSPYCEACAKAVRKRKDAEKQRERRKTEEAKEKGRIRSAERYKNDPRVRDYLNEYERNRTKSDPKFALNRRVRALIGSSLRRYNSSKNGKSWKLVVGYSIDELFNHIERQFLPGMSWENRDEWHVDHIVPVASFDYDSPDHPDFKACWALTNLRPLWSGDNIRKSDKRIFLI